MIDQSIVWIVMGAIASLLGTLTTYLVGKAGYRSKFKDVAAKVTAETYRQRMRRLSRDLAKASSMIDYTLTEMTEVTKVRENSMRTLEKRLNDLTNDEKKMQTRVDALKQIPLPAVEYFLQATEKSEKRSAARDYLLFGAGVVVSTAVTIILKLFFGI